VILMFCIALPAMVTAVYYSEAIELPCDYNAACKTIEETKELLLEYEDAGLASGLEALALKQSLKDAIEKRNNLEAEINAWLANPFMPFKDVLKVNLKN